MLGTKGGETIAKGKPTTTPVKWWQWVFMYPALAIALVSHAPKLYQLYESYKLNVRYSYVDTALKTNDKWERNFECLQNMKFHTVTTSGNACISVGVCPSGDLLVQVQPPDPKARPILQWISWAEITKENRAVSSVSLLVKEAAAEQSTPLFEVAQAGPMVICQKWVGRGLLLMRIRYPNGQCFDQIINTYTGAVISTVPAPCDPRCQ